MSVGVPGKQVFGEAQIVIIHSLEWRREREGKGEIKIG